MTPKFLIPLSLACVIAILITFYAKSQENSTATIERAFNNAMEQANKNHVRAGCFYYLNDSTIIKKQNFK